MDSNLIKANDVLIPEDVVNGFEIGGTLTEIKRLGNGHINRTYFVSFDDNGVMSDYVFQRINTKVFKMPVELMNNVVLVTEHIRRKTKEAGEDPERATIHFVRSKDGSYLYKDNNGEYWRAYRFLDNCIVYEQVERYEDFEKAGVALGRFQKMLSDFPADKLCETIPNFHNTVSRVKDFEKIIAADPEGRRAGCEAEVQFVLERRAYASRVLDAIATGEVPVRVTHNDTKLNNVLMDKYTNEVLCLIDLDTVMPGSALYDFGDSIRFGASSAAEDEQDLSKVNFVPALYDAYKKGYLSEAGDVLTEKELELLPFSAILMTYECGMRFLGDHIDGDNYFSISRPGHNLDRARTQFKLVSDMEKYFGIKA